MTDDASAGTTGSGSGAGIAAGTKSVIEDELNQLRDMGLAKKPHETTMTMTDDASAGATGSGSGAGITAGAKSAIEDELNQLRGMGLAKNQRAKYKSTGSETAFMTPEEAASFLADQKTASKKGQLKPTPPKGLSAGDLDSWYMQQKAREIEARKKREEAEAILRGYRMSHESSGKRDASSSDRRQTGANCENDASHDSKASSSKPPMKDMKGVVSTIDARGMFQAMDKRQSLGPDGTGNRKLGVQTSASKDEEKKTDHDDEKEKEATWNFITNAPGSKYTPEPERYHLFLSIACPWSHRALMVRALKGLDSVVSVTTTHPIWQKTKPEDPTDGNIGWVFGDPDGNPLANCAGLGGPFPPAFNGNEPDSILNAYSVRDIYEHAKISDGKCTVPILWDKKTNTIVSNESWQIMRMLNSSFNDFAKNPELDLYPIAERNKIDAILDWIDSTINNGVYRCGFATTQAAYDESIDELTASFDRVDSILQKQRYIAGSKLTEADVRLFVTLLRFDEVYALYFKCNTRSVAATSAILNYCREIYQMTGVPDTCDMDQIKAHYYCSHVELNKYSIVPRGTGFMKLLSMPHNRDNL